MSGRGLFIVLEGIDGSGKTTLRDRICAALTSRGIAAVSTAEPTEGRIGSILRDGGTDNPYAEVFLFMADRACHTDEIMGMVEEGRTVVCDRYYASTLAYQSAGDSPVDIGLLRDLNARVAVEPDITFLLDIDPEAGMGRVAGRGEDMSKFERLDFQRRVRDRYLEIAGERGFVVLDATLPQDELLSVSMEYIMERMR
ncbi:MAG: dTMP kinase [Candidatus Methanomethylophilaceae archaeon]